MCIALLVKNSSDILPATGTRAESTSPRPPNLTSTTTSDSIANSHSLAATLSLKPNMRSMNMPGYNSQQQQQPNTGARQTPRLQNTQKPGPGLGGNSTGGWGFGLPNNSAGGNAPGGFAGAAAAGAALGGAPGLGPRPTQLSGFAQVMGGGGSQAPIVMR